MRSRQLRQTSICQFSTSSWSLLQDLARYQTYGFHSIGVWERKVREAGVDAAVDALFDSRMNISSMHWAGGFTGDDGRLKDTVENSVQTIRLASRIGAPCVLIHSGSQNGHIFNHVNKLVRSKLGEMVAVANDYGVTLALEPIIDQPHSPWTIYRTLDQYLELLDQVPELKINFDLYHLGLYEEVYERLEEFVGRIQLVQLADRTLGSIGRSQIKTNRRYSYRVPLGEGDVAIESWITRLNELGYNGRYEVEMHGLGVTSDHFELMDHVTEYLTSDSIQEVLHPTRSTV